MDEQRDLAWAEIRSHREFSHPNLMPLLDCAFLGVPQGEAAFMLFPFMDGESLNTTLPVQHKFGDFFPAVRIYDDRIMHRDYTISNTDSVMSLWWRELTILYLIPRYFTKC